MDLFKLFAVEPQLDGSDHIFDGEYCAKMKLPFQYGWDHYRVYQGDTVVFQGISYREARNTTLALNSIQLLEAA